MAKDLSALPLLADSPRMEPRIIIVCDSETAEFQAVSFELLMILPDAVYRLVDRLECLENELAQEPYPDLILFVQSWPDEYSFAKLLTLRGIGPFTRLLSVYGPWCGSDGRSRQNWPLALRVSLESFAVELKRFSRQLLDESLTQQGASDHVLPWTAGRDEVFFARYGKQSGGRLKLSRRLQSLKIFFETSDLALQCYWRDLLQHAGLGEIVDHEPSLELMLWDPDPVGLDFSNEEVAGIWERDLRPNRTRKVVVVAGHQTPDEVNRWQSLGAVAVVSKLLPADAFLKELVRICDERGPG